MQALIETYIERPKKSAPPEQYDRIVALKAPFDSRLEALKARKDALKTRFDAIEEELTAQEQPLARMKKLDLALLAQRQMKTAALARRVPAASGRLRLLTHRAQLERETPPPPTSPRC